MSCSVERELREYKVLMNPELREYEVLVFHEDRAVTGEVQRLTVMAENACDAAGQVLSEPGEVAFVSTRSLRLSPIVYRAEQGAVRVVQA